MPELPEVETIVRGLRAADDPHREGVVGKTIRQAQVLWERSVAQPTAKAFAQEIAGQKIHTVERRGKFLVFQLDRQVLLVHLRMSGDLFLEREPGSRDARHDRVIFLFTDGSRLVFNDTRKFGRVWLVDDVTEVTGGLGPEPFDANLNASTFLGKLNKSQRKIKPLLLDQSFLAGLGNIYTDEALFLACIHPETLSSELDYENACHLLAAIRCVLQEGIKRNGASIDWVYRGGDFQNQFNVYQRDGNPCKRCGTPIERMVVGQRGTHYCPNCQSRTA